MPGQLIINYQLIMNINDDYISDEEDIEEEEEDLVIQAAVTAAISAALASIDYSQTY
jgi:hypothetical protein